MPVLKNAKHEQFAREVADGNSAAGAYRKLWPDASPATAETNGPALARGAQVALRIRELREVANEASSLTRAGMVKFLERIIQAKPSEASEESDICETTMTKAGPFTAVCSKMAAAEKLIKMCGWNEPEKQEVKVSGSISIDGLDEIVRQVFRPV